jgi:hypothetical protein
MTTSIKTMTTDLLGPIINRVYGETHRYQWARETAINAEEAGATRIEFTVEPQGVAAHRVYRRLIVDDGAGMDPDQLEAFFNTFGKGSKAIGGVHENYGIGAKVALLPWNKQGVVVVSRQDGQDYMIRLRCSPSGEYGLEQFETEDGSTDTVVQPFEDEASGIDWSRVLPAWVGDHGTAIVLFGNTPNEDTVIGDRTFGREEDGTRGLAGYLNNRLWVPNIKIRALEFNKPAVKAEWPTTFEGMGTFNDKHFVRTIYGTHHFIGRPATYPRHTLASGTVDVGGGVAMDWYLWPKDTPIARTDDKRSPKTKTGGVMVLYKNEIYDWSVGLTSLMRDCGIVEKAVADCLWIVVRPPHDDGERGQVGVRPRGDRAKLNWTGGLDLPMTEWAMTFADQMPHEIEVALKQARKDEPVSIDDAKLARKLADRFGLAFKMERLRIDPAGTERAGDPIVADTRSGGTQRADPSPKVRPKGRPNKRVGTTPTYALPGDLHNATKVTVRGGFPNCEFTDNPVDSDVAWAAVYIAPRGTANENGLIRIWRHHPAMAKIVRDFQSEHPGRHAEDVRIEVEGVYREMMMCKVAHSEQMVGDPLVGALKVATMRTPAALTMALLGLIGEQAVIRQRLAQKVGRRRPQADASVAPVASADIVVLRPATA